MEAALRNQVESLAEMRANRAKVLACEAADELTRISRPWLDAAVDQLVTTAATSRVAAQASIARALAAEAEADVFDEEEA